MLLQKLVAWMRLDGLKAGTKVAPFKPRPRPLVTPLTESAFSPNPGNLRMFCYVPKGLKPGAPLVVTLHGCGQTASGYDVGTGWCVLADQLGFAVLAPEQKAANNPHTCFNWFDPADTTLGQGECASIATMIRTIVETKRLDATKVFITGLSAGGAMTAVMLATYPELFAGGAIIAGLPFGVASNVRDAIDAMRSAPLRTPQQWGNAVRAVSNHSGPWPKISIWHGALDTTVNVNNAQAGVAQWADVHGLGLTSAKQEFTDGAIRLSWGDKLELYTIATLGHGIPIDSRDIGTAGPFILDVGISSSRRIAKFWDLAPKTLPKRAPKPAPVEIVTSPEPSLPQIEAELGANDVVQPLAENLIRRALKAVGLLKR